MDKKWREWDDCRDEEEPCHEKKRRHKKDSHPKKPGYLQQVNSQSQSGSTIYSESGGGPWLGTDSVDGPSDKSPKPQIEKDVKVCVEAEEWANAQGQAQAVTSGYNYAESQDDGPPWVRSDEKK